MSAEKTPSPSVEGIEFYKKIINAFAHPLLVIDARTYEVLFTNSETKQCSHSGPITCYYLHHRTEYKCDPLENACPVDEARRLKKPVLLEQSFVIDGVKRTFEVHGHPVFDDAGEVVQVIEYSIDITKRKSDELLLKKLGRAIEYSPACVVITDRHGSIEYVNPKFSSLTGYGIDEVMGQNPRILKSGVQDREFYDTLWSTIRSGKVWNGEFHNKKKNGESYWENASISPIMDEQGSITHFVAVKEDITERKRTVEALHTINEKLAERNLIMERNLKLAQIAQEAFIQKDVPRTDMLDIDFRFMPLETVGGDYFNIKLLDRGDIGAFIGDVAGHGVASALFLALVKFNTEHMFRMFSREPVQFLERLNEELTGAMTSYFITGIYGYFERISETGQVRFTFSNGAHPLPIVTDRQGSCYSAGNTGSIIGVFDRVNYPLMQIILSPGDRVFLYTDGIPETANTDNQIIGFDETLRELFQRANRADLHTTLDAIIQEIHQFRGIRPLDDDIILIGFEVK